MSQLLQEISVAIAEAIPIMCGYVPYLHGSCMKHMLRMRTVSLDGGPCVTVIKGTTYM